MPSFTDFWAEYEGTERVDLGHGFWAELKRSLSEEESAACDAKLVDKNFVSDQSGHTQTQMDFAAWRREMIFLSLVDWNLVGRDGQPMPKDRKGIAQLPRPVFNKLLAVCQGLNGERGRQAEADFPEGSENGDQAREGGAAGPTGLSDREGSVQAAGPPSLRMAEVPEATDPGLPDDHLAGGGASA